MKIGILTFHYAHNYGAMLQAYALVTFLRKKGYDAKIVDYRLPYIYDLFELLDFKGFFARYRKKNSFIVSFLKSLKNYSKHRKKSEKWFQFEKFLNETLVKTKRVYGIDDINSLQMDAFICGSDQIWNSKLTGRLEPLYFCEGLKSDSLKISYAASNGNECVDVKDWNAFNSYLGNFDFVSVRENGLHSFLINHGIDCTLVCDPVFLLGKDEWQNICQPVKEMNYLLTYSFNENPDFFDEAQKLANKMNLRLVCFLFRKNENLPSDVIQVIDGGPKDFVSYFNAASFVITNSFHGTAFSILMQKQFYSVPPMKGRERTDSLLKSLGLEKRIVYKDFDVDITIDYHKVNIKLNDICEQSNLFLFNSLSVNK